MRRGTAGCERQQEGYTLVRRSYRMRVEVVEGLEGAAKSLHCSRAALLNDLLVASLRYVSTGDTLALNEIRNDIRFSAAE